MDLWTSFGQGLLVASPRMSAGCFAVAFALFVFRYVLSASAESGPDAHAAGHDHDGGRGPSAMGGGEPAVAVLAHDGFVPGDQHGDDQELVLRRCR